MRSPFKVQYFPHTVPGTKQAYDLQARKEVQDVMDRVYKENPSYWPYGLSIPGHDGGVYAIRDSRTEKIAGWVGWQERDRNRKKIGYYSVGLLPEYRGQGLAKEAVADLIRLKAGGVDEVRSLIVRTNAASKALARSLDIPIDELG